MKYLLTFVLLCFSVAASAQSDFTVSWNVTGLSSSTIVSVEYDLDVGTNYIGAHGSVTLSNDLSLPSTGSCFVTSGGGVLCNLSLNALTAVLDMGANLNGVIKIIDSSGNTTESGALIVDTVN